MRITTLSQQGLWSKNRKKILRASLRNETRRDLPRVVLESEVMPFNP
ncbi:hypothetical protein HMPREF1869_00011 [Bacteroidales bacterium KA00251]|nr:hypothetical protein HMPREF1869_00011 [Bacteroidales bacterium KA00251]